MKAKSSFLIALMRFVFDHLPQSIKPQDVQKKLTRDMRLEISWRQNNDCCSQGPILMVNIEDLNPWNDRVEFATNYLTVL
jgi:NADH:ubiquinone oxidoreductase subunit E